MKPQVLKISLNPEQSFSARHDVVPVFYNKWHYHKELELIYIIRGSGSLFIGYEIKHFKTGDLVLLGSNLPHMWGSDKSRDAGNSFCESYVIHFLPECIGPNFFQLPENKSLQKILNKAEKGLYVFGNEKDTIVRHMKKIISENGTERLITLLQILNYIAGSKENRPICGELYDSSVKIKDSERLNDIYQYIDNNFHKPLKLEEIALIANLTPNAFCRYFKSRTRKSFSRFLIELRINHACKLLAETEKPVADVCFDCGYNSFSNFNKHFKMITRKTPLEHRKFFWENEK